MKTQEQNKLLRTLQTRFEQHMPRHAKVTWAKVRARLDARPDALSALHHMEETGGEPDVIAYDSKTGTVTFCDCAAESPKDRRSLCFDDAALKARKENKPRGSATGMATDMGVALVTEEEYRLLQTLGEFDLKTSSWVSTPSDVRALGGALFCDRRFGRVFTYHNGAESYYAARGFRGIIHV